MALTYVWFVVVPLVLALFPAAALVPAVDWLVRRRVPRAAAALLWSAACSWCWPG